MSDGINAFLGRKVKPPTPEEEAETRKARAARLKAQLEQIDAETKARKAIVDLLWELDEGGQVQVLELVARDLDIEHMLRIDPDDDRETR